LQLLRQNSEGFPTGMRMVSLEVTAIRTLAPVQKAAQHETRGEWSLVVDLGTAIGSLSWFRGLATCGALCWAALSLAPANSESVPFSLPPGPEGEAAVDEAKSLGLAWPIGGGPTGSASQALSSEAGPAGASKPFATRLSIIVRETGGLRLALRQKGLSEQEAASVFRQIQSLVPATDRSSGTTLHLQFGRRTAPENARPLEELSYRSALGREVALRKTGGAWALTATGMAIETTPLKILGQVDADLDGGTAPWPEDRGGPRNYTNLARPVPGVVTSGFGYRRHPILGYWRMHNGVDIRAAYGTPILAAADGRVSHAGWAGGRGKEVRLNHAHSLSTSYAHMSVVGVAEGEIVRRNDVIGYVGSTGLSTGPHVHFEVRKYGRPLDPALAGLETR